LLFLGRVLNVYKPKIKDQFSVEYVHWNFSFGYKNNNDNLMIIGIIPDDDYKRLVVEEPWLL